MKKYISGTIAICLAICLTGFSVLPKKITEVTVVYTGDVYDLFDVENPQNWQLITSPSCHGLYQACEFTIDESYINTSTYPYSLNYDVLIYANGNSLDGYRPVDVIDVWTSNSIYGIIQNKGF